MKWEKKIIEIAKSSFRVKAGELNDKLLNDFSLVLLGVKDTVSHKYLTYGKQIF